MSYAYELQLDDLPPLGTMTDFAAERRARSIQAAAIPHISPDADPQTSRVFADLADFTKSFQARYDIQPVELTPADVHLVSTATVGRIATMLGRDEAGIGGLYDPQLDISYVLEPEQPDRMQDRLQTYYVLGHETGHRETQALSHTYFPGEDTALLKEGLADKFAISFMHDVVLPRHAPVVADALAYQLPGDEAPYTLGALPLRSEEIYYIDRDTGNASVFCRAVEMRVLEHVESMMGPDVYSEFMSTMRAPDTLAPRQVFIENLGLDTWNLITADSSQTPAIDILRHLLQ